MIDFTTGFGGSLIDHGLGVASGCTRLGLQGIARLVGGLFVVSTIATWIYNLYFHPLAAFPGPFLGRCSLVYRFIHSSRGRIHVAVADAHKVYGDIVRIAPNELSFASVESWAAVYGHSKAGNPIPAKGPFYEVFAAGFSQKCVGSERDPKKHSAMRKMMSPAFSQRGLLEQEKIIAGTVDKFVKVLGEKAGPGTAGLNMTKWYEMDSFDILGEMAFGESFHSLESGTPHFWADTVLEHLYIITLIDNLRRIGWLSTLVRWVVPQWVATSSPNSNYSRAQVKKRLESDTSRQDFVSLLVDKVREGVVSQEEMAAHVSTLTIAGGETVATTLSGLTCFLNQNPETLEQLTQEVRRVFQNYEDITATKAQQLPYLKACLHEALRLFPPASGGAPRVSPGFELHGMHIPEGADINVSAWSISHNPRYFADPWAFKPERWLDPNATDNKDASRPFLLGPRDCLGRNFAWMELSLVVSKLVWTYDMELVSKDVDFLTQSTLHVLWWKPKMFVRWLQPKSRAQSLTGPTL